MEEEKIIEELPVEHVKEEIVGRELSEEEYGNLNPEARQRYSICHPDRCPNVGRPMPHYPHVPLNPTDLC